MSEDRIKNAVPAVALLTQFINGHFLEVLLQIRELAWSKDTTLDWLSLPLKSKLLFIRNETLTCSRPLLLTCLQLLWQLSQSQTDSARPGSLWTRPLASHLFPPCTILERRLVHEITCLIETKCLTSKHVVNCTMSSVSEQEVKRLPFKLMW